MSDLDDAFRAGKSLDPDERLQLVARLWKTLPPGHRAALVTLQLEDVQGDREQSAIRRQDPKFEPLWPKLLFDPNSASGLYSAPRRFDLATIFVVTAAFSLLLGGLSLLGATPLVMIVITSLLAIIGITQALFQHVASPRGVSIITGAIAYTLISWIIWYTVPFAFPVPFFVVMFINGLIGGSLLGYMFGTLVGGVFLIADVVRRKFSARAQANAANNSVGGQVNPWDDAGGRVISRSDAQNSPTHF
jgi:hypothetical protein